MSTRKRKQITFPPISQPGGGKLHLTIVPPGSWFDSDKYVVFVGGGGIGDVDSLEDAKQLLFDGVVDYCDQRVFEAQQKMDFYTKLRTKLKAGGIKCLGKGKTEVRK